MADKKNFDHNNLPINGVIAKAAKPPVAIACYYGHYTIFPGGSKPPPYAKLRPVSVGRGLGPAAHPVGKSYASKVDDEKSAF